LALTVVLANLFCNENKRQDRHRHKQSGLAQLTGGTPRPSEAA
jgi:hypothetical protein